MRFDEFPPRYRLEVARPAGGRSMLRRAQLAVAMVKAALIGMGVVLVAAAATAATVARVWIILTAALLACAGLIRVDVVEVDEEGEGQG